MGIFTSLKDKWSSSFVTRDQVAEFSGGILHPRTMANKDSLKLGPKGRVRMGRTIAYPVDELISWMESRTVAVDELEVA